MAEQCKCCEQTKELRLGFCFDCAELESVIYNGTDMYDNEIPKNEEMSSHMNKLKYIINRLKSGTGN